MKKTLVSDDPYLRAGYPSRTELAWASLIPLFVICARVSGNSFPSPCVIEVELAERARSIEPAMRKAILKQLVDILHNVLNKETMTDGAA